MSSSSTWKIGRWFQPDVTVDRRHRHRAEDEIQQLLAGPLAKARYRGLGALDTTDLDGAHHDHEAVVDLAMRF
jgi:hypothetical protein